MDERNGKMEQAFKGIVPQIAPSVMVAPGAQVIGDVELRENVSVWYNAVLRGDMAKITVGALLTPRTVIPDNSMVMGSPAKVKRELTVEEIEAMQSNAAEYVSLAKEYAE